MVFGWLVHPDECQSPTNTEKSSSLLKVLHQVTVGTSGMGKSMNKTRHMGPHLSNELTAENRAFDHFHADFGIFQSRQV